MLQGARSAGNPRSGPIRVNLTDPLVGIEGIAALNQSSVETAKRITGKATFPRPVVAGRDGKALWSKAAVSQWLCEWWSGRHPEQMEMVTIGTILPENERKKRKDGDQKSEAAREEKSNPQNGEMKTTAQQVAEETKTSKNTVERAGTFSEAVDKIREASPAIAKQIMQLSLFGEGR